MLCRTVLEDAVGNEDNSAMVRVFEPVDGKEFFARLHTALELSIGRSTSFFIEGTAGELFIKPTADDVKMLRGFLTHIEKAMSTSQAQVEVSVEREHGRDLLHWTYRFPKSSAESKILVEETEFEGSTDGVVYPVMQDNGAELLLPLGFGAFQLSSWYPFFDPPLHLRKPGEFKCTHVFTACTQALSDFKQRVRNVNKKVNFAMLEPQSSDANVNQNLEHEAEKSKQMDSSILAFYDFVAPVLEFCLLASGCRSMAQLLGDTPGHNMAGKVKHVIFWLV